MGRFAGISLTINSHYGKLSVICRLSRNGASEGIRDMPRPFHLGGCRAMNSVGRYKRLVVLFFDSRAFECPTNGETF
jgi:hypothetical protein